MKLEKAMKRDRKHDKKKNGMRKDGASVFVIQQAIVNRAKVISKVNEVKK